jgi:hypothetical protein
MLLDELMGRACVAAGSPGMTVSLQVRYHRPVPLETPLRVHARVTGTEGARSSLTARSASRRTRRSPWSPRTASSSRLTPTAPAACSRVCRPGGRHQVLLCHMNERHKTSLSPGSRVVEE